jgi:ferredoxin-NADP reductase
MAEQLEWRNAKLLRTRDLTRDIRLFEIEPAGDFVIPKAGSHINVTVQIGGTGCPVLLHRGTVR